LVGSVSFELAEIGLNDLQLVSAMLVSEVFVAQPVSRKAIDSRASLFGFSRIDLASFFYGSPFDLPALLNARRVPSKKRNKATDRYSKVQPVAG
jgi:hypothetical protein